MNDLEAKAREIVARWNLADDDALETLIAHALADEREACAQVAEQMADGYTTDRCVETKELSIICEEECHKVAAAIRQGRT